MIDTHRFATYILLYLFSGGFRGTSLFTNEAMFFVTYVVILQKSDKNPTEMWVAILLKKKISKKPSTSVTIHFSSEVLYRSFRPNKFFCFFVVTWF